MIEKNIITFITLVEEGNMVKCAKKLCLTQPAITQQIRALEGYYGIELFKKDGRRLALTKKGEQFYDMCHRLYTIDRKIMQHMEDNRITITIGVTHSINEGIMSNIMTLLLEHFPQYNIKLLVNNTKSLIKSLENGEVDMSLLEGSFDHSHYVSYPFMRSSFIGICKKSGAYQDIKTIEDAFNAPLLLREEGSGTRDILNHILVSRGYELSSFKKIYELGSIPVIRSLIKEDMGISFMYDIAAKEMLENGEACPLSKDILYLERELWFAALPEHPNLSDIEKIYDFITNKVEVINP